MSTLTTDPDPAVELVLVDEDDMLPVRDRVARALRDGGRARVTVTSRATGRHLTVKFAAKAKGEDGRYISRARKAGRVGIEQADTVFVDVGDDAVLASDYVGCYFPGSEIWSFPDTQDERLPSYQWAARRVLEWALSPADSPRVTRFDADAEAALAAECHRCGRPLTDPISLRRGVGPECAGKATASEHV